MFIGLNNFSLIKLITDDFFFILREMLRINSERSIIIINDVIVIILGLIVNWFWIKMKISDLSDFVSTY